MKRALRLDKLALALLDETLKAYENADTVAERIPLLRNLALPMAELDRRATIVADALVRHPRRNRGRGTKPSATRQRRPARSRAGEPRRHAGIR